MKQITDIISSPGFWGILIPAMTAVVGWLATENRKLFWERYRKKEERYIELMETLGGFYDRSPDPDLVNRWVRNYRLCWLYAPDQIIYAANSFMRALTDKTKSGKERQPALALLVLAIRTDLRKNSQLGMSDVLHLPNNLKITPPTDAAPPP